MMENRLLFFKLPLIEMKLVANRPQDLMDIEELRRVERLNNEKA